MNIKDATRLQLHIRRMMPKWKPEARQLGNGEWIVTLIIGNIQKFVWSIRDWDTTFALPEHRLHEEEQVLV